MAVCMRSQRLSSSSSVVSSDFLLSVQAMRSYKKLAQDLLSFASLLQNRLSSGTPSSCGCFLLPFAHWCFADVFAQLISISSSMI
jgi:hypothetical protein